MNLKSRLAQQDIVIAPGVFDAWSALLAERAEAYREAGADVLFIEALRSPEQMRHQTAIVQHLHQVGGNRLAGQRFTRRQVVDASGFRVDPHPVSGANAPGIGAHHGGQAQVERIAVKQARERFGHQRGDAQVLERLWRLFAR